MGMQYPQTPFSASASVSCSLRIDDSGIVITLVIGAVGTTLSDFKPAPLPA